MARSMAARPYCKSADVKVGDVLITDDGFLCMPANVKKVVGIDFNGRYIKCEVGKHYIDAQIDHEYNLVGLTKHDSK